MHLAAALWLAAAPGFSKAHESPLPTATLVQREGGHLALSLRLDPLPALHRAQQGKATPAESLASWAAMEPERFADLWHHATQRWSSECAVVAQGRVITASRWVWPSARDAQTLLQRQLMPQLTGHHGEHELLEVRAEFRIGSEGAGRLELRLPAAFRPLTLTTLRPRQIWAGEGDRPIGLVF